MKRFFCLSLMLLVLTGCAKKEKPAVSGNPAPGFTVKDLGGHEVRLADLKGKIVMLNFWATWCPPCREEIPAMMRLNEAMAGKPFQMLAVSIDEGGKAAVEDFFKKSGTTLPACLDSDQSASKLYGITGVPETFVIDKNGVIVKKVVGALDWSKPEVITFFTEASMK